MFVSGSLGAYRRPEVVRDSPLGRGRTPYDFLLASAKSSTHTESQNSDIIHCPEYQSVHDMRSSP